MFGGVRRLHLRLLPHLLVLRRFPTLGSRLHDRRAWIRPV